MKLSFRRRLFYVGAAIGALTLTGAGIGTAQASTGIGSLHSHPAAAKPTVVLVHGAWADGSSWDKVTAKLQHDGYRVVTPPNLLSGVENDAANLRAYLDTITGPVVLVGHSYGGTVITNAALGDEQIKALVYVDAYIPDTHDSVYSLTSAQPGSVFAADPSTLFDQVAIPGAEEGNANLYVKPSIFGKAFADKTIPAKDVAVLAARQRPLASKALLDESGEPAWRTIPSWSVIGKQDAVIPAAEQIAMSKRAKAHTVEINAPHLSMVTDAGAVTNQIEAAAKATN
ncbi:alpha/beta fold hydrolase [Micromonospora parathelypteridis]|uniref:Pimeloyl-ACP methyl ester carboxylesterase n=1 Tax=Micromonospora parathelypteridis TaxID=1839617 RepID=A0A840VVH3_9ACTN|nr:alpha/beta hydrolase [Micromonospora parathelypteridis]MBB5476199.1 pimeloyl-ACP methyl ester carboxylesterase [Micromonospora parathelypteridis]GGO13927.1 alpha/beta hydrolase [Micromonospora parathelypteridis]